MQFNEGKLAQAYKKLEDARDGAIEKATAKKESKKDTK